jgi:hypothetical protein
MYTVSTTPNQRMVPRNASSMYVGRQELGERLAQVFSHDSLNPPKRQRIFVIVGIGGTGKSEVCLKFSEDQRDEYVSPTSYRYRADNLGTGAFSGLTLAALPPLSKDMLT